MSWRIVAGAGLAICSYSACGQTVSIPGMHRLDEAASFGATVTIPTDSLGDGPFYRIIVSFELSPIGGAAASKPTVLENTVVDSNGTRHAYHTVRGDVLQTAKPGERFFEYIYLSPGWDPADGDLSLNLFVYSETDEGAGYQGDVVNDVRVEFQDFEPDMVIPGSTQLPMVFEDTYQGEFSLEGLGTNGAFTSAEVRLRARSIEGPVHAAPTVEIRDPRNQRNAGSRRALIVGNTVEQGVDDVIAYSAHLFNFAFEPGILPATLRMTSYPWPIEVSDIEIEFHRDEEIEWYPFGGLSIAHPRALVRGSTIDGGMYYDVFQRGDRQYVQHELQVTKTGEYALEVLSPSGADGHIAYLYESFDPDFAEFDRIGTSAAPMTLEAGRVYDLVIVARGAGTIETPDQFGSIGAGWYRAYATGPGIAYVGDEPPTEDCLADFDKNGTRNVQDLLAYLSAFRGRENSADINGTPGITVQDLLAFLSVFRAGC